MNETASSKCAQSRYLSWSAVLGARDMLVWVLARLSAGSGVLRVGLQSKPRWL